MYQVHTGAYVSLLVVSYNGQQTSLKVYSWHLVARKANMRVKCMSG